MTVLCACCALFYFSILLSIQAPLAFSLFALLIWAGAALALEDVVPSGELISNRRHLFSSPKRKPWAAMALLVLFARGCLVQTSSDPYLAVAPIIFGLLLALLVVPFKQLRQFHQPLQALALCPLLLWLPPLIPNAPLSHGSAALSSVVLNLVGIPAIHDGSIVDLASASVRVAGPCAGADLITQALVVGLLALVLVPLPQQQLRLPLLLLAPICGWIANVLRIALLAILAASDPAAAASDSGMFGFFHLGNGGLLFSGLAISVYGLLYGHWLERGIRQRGL